MTVFPLFFSNFLHVLNLKARSFTSLFHISTFQKQILDHLNLLIEDTPILFLNQCDNSFL